MDNSLKITALRVEAAVAVLKQSGAKEASVERIRADLEDGAPVNDDGTINLIFYAAWLAKQTGGEND